MIKWFLRIGYIAFFVLVGYFVLYPLTESQMFESFLNDNKEQVLNDPLFLTNTLVNQSVGNNRTLIIQKEPLFAFNEEKDGYGLEFYVYSLYDRDEQIELFVILIQNVRIKEVQEGSNTMSFNLDITFAFDHAIFNDDNSSILLDEKTEKINHNLGKSDENNKNPNIAFIKKDLLRRNDDEAQFANLILFNISYVLFDGNNEIQPANPQDRNFVSLYDEARLETSTKQRFSVDKFPDTQKTFDLATDKMVIKELDNNNLLFSEHGVLNSDFISENVDLSGYTSYLFRNYSILIAVGLIGGYFLFFHRKVMNIIKDKKFKKAQDTNQ